MDTRASMTARLCAYARGLHVENDAEPKILADHLALALAGFGEDEPDDVQAQMRTYERLPLRAVMTFRTRWVEDILRQQPATAPLQYVIMGAGLDSFAYRKPDALYHVQVFEIDHPASQDWKIERLKSLGHDPSDNVTFVPVDFETERFDARLATAGLKPDCATVFSAMGLCQYITEDAMRDTAERIANMTTAHCELVMNYNLPIEMLPPETQEPMRRIMAHAADTGEPWLSHYSPDTISDLLRGVGFKRFEHMNPERIAAEYFAGRSDGLAISPAAHLVRAIRD